ncbi:YIP1 family protein [Paenibacillus sp. OV219]|uniref:YIP1 family protein n=1 Tax=Paenibacillus sp. OV219 TaxID=1884377 RepID=UPI0008C97164|nr:YIP1 family protein [Paenibacillus sp. OV219]SEM57739.1 Yip1 domain-containing protein [Paenibacillus sp. OV219]
MFRFKRIIILLAAIALLLSCSTAYADVPYNTFTIDGGKGIMMQNAYTPVGAIDGYSIFGENEAASKGKVELRDPQDIFVDNEDNVYIADTGNGRIVELDSWGNFIRIIGDGQLKQPRGVFVTETHDIYVADYGKQSVVVFGQDGKLKSTIGKPKSKLYGKDTPFKPQKVIVDKRGSIYIIGEGLIQGLVRLSPEGKFLGYFGGNRAGFNLLKTLQRIFYTKQQLSKMTREMPISPTNISVDEEGLIYTSTSGINGGAIKKLNVAGKDLLGGTWSLKQVSDVTVDRMGNIFAVDSMEGLILEYNRDGNLMFIFSGSDTGEQRLGLLRAPTGIAVTSDGRLLVLSGERGNVQVFKQTAFTALVHEALGLYLDGKYVQSREPWNEVLRQNSLFSLAHTGIGLAYFKEGNYKDAFAEFQFSKNKAEYSNAYWELRRIWIMDHAVDVALAFAGAIVLYAAVRFSYRRFSFGAPVVKGWTAVKEQGFVAQLLHPFRMLRHPIDGYYELEHNGKASIASATVLLVLMFVVRMIGLYTTNFLFATMEPLQINFVTELLKLTLPLFAWVISNYLVSVINDGEGSFKNIYKGTVYALSPYIIFAIPLAILSRGLTLMEGVIYNYSYDFVIVWSALLIFIMVKEIHGYEIKETVRNIVLTLIGMLIMAFVAFILFGLSNQVWEFVYSLFQEVNLRVH